MDDEHLDKTSVMSAKEGYPYYGIKLYTPDDPGVALAGFDGVARIIVIILAIVQICEWLK